MNPWKFGGVWSWITLSGNRNALGGCYAGWRIWCDPETVKKVEQLVIEGKFTEALECTIY